MIAAHVLPGGGVRLQATSPGEEARLRVLLYVKAAEGGRFLTWWTYIDDLKRDLGARLKFTSGSSVSLRGIVDRVKARDRGDDARILSLFNPETPPHHYQLRGIATGLNVERLLLADDVGLGKTIQIVGMLLEAFRRRHVRRALIVCPAGLRQQWYEEIYKFARPESLPGPVVVASGPAAQRRHLYPKRWRVLILNPELLLRDRERIAKIAHEIDFVAIDEASCIKNEETKLARTIQALFKRTRYRIAATATPIENGLADLFAVFRWIDPRVFLSRAYFNRRYVVWRKSRFRVRNRQGRSCLVVKLVPTKFVNLNEVKAKIRPCFLRRRAHEVGQELPALVVKWEVLELPPKQREAYESCREETEKKIVGLRGEALRAELTALRQACNSTALVMERGAVGKPSQVKVDRLRELLGSELSGERVILFTEYARFAALLARELRQFRPALYTGQQDKRDRQASINSFLAGTSRVLVATKAGERGHNLQVASVVVNVDLPWNPASLKQRIGRARRLRSEHQCVRVINMIAAGTIEETLLLKKTYSKRKVFEDVFGEDELTLADPLENMVGRDLRGLL